MSVPDRDAQVSARYVLGLLLLVYILNFVDRSILSILVPAIQRELHFSDSQLGLLGGPAFALFYTALGIPIGVLADRTHRVRIIAIAIALWSLFSALTGVAQSLLQLFLARLGVGIGEAGGVAPAYALISDYFPVERRARALAIFAFGSPIGTAAGILFGGLLASHTGWRTPLVSIGIAGLLYAPWFLHAVPEPRRGSLDAPGTGTQGAAPTGGSARAALLATESFWGLACGGALCSIPGYGLLFWLPSLFVRSYHLSLPRTACYFAALTLIGGVAGLWSGGWVTDRLGRTARGAYAAVPAVASLLCIPCYVLGVVGEAAAWRLGILIVPTALALVWLGPTICAVQHLVRADQRAYASAALLFVVNLIGIGVGAALIGWLSDDFARRFGADSLRYAILAVIAFYLPAAGCFGWAACRLRRDWLA